MWTRAFRRVRAVDFARRHLFHAVVVVAGDAMQELLIPDVDDAVLARLEARAARAGKSLEELVCEILADAMKPGGVVTLAPDPDREEPDGR